jgi:hypothetical protein
MELTSDILLSKINQDSDITTIIKLKNLDLFECTKKLKKEEFLELIATKKYVQTMEQFLKELFYINPNIKLTKAVLQAFYLSGYKREIFSIFYTTRLDERVLYYANKVIAYIYKIVTKNNTQIDEFKDSIDHYYSLYKIWVSKDILEQIDNEMDNFKDNLETYTVFNQLNNDDVLKYIHNMQSHINNMIDINNMLCIKLLIKYYNQFKNIEQVKDYFWLKIRDIASSNFNHIIIILLAELRHHSIYINENIKARKDLYYNIDIDNIIKKVRNQQDVTQDFDNAIKILNNHTHKIIIKSNSVIDNIILLYDTIY